MTQAQRAVRIGLALSLLLASAQHAEATPLGIFDESVHDSIEIVFQFDPFTPGGVLNLGLGMPSSLVPPSPGYLGCDFALFVGGSQVSSTSITSTFGCQGWWTGDAGATADPLIDDFVDLTGLAAGQVGKIVMRPMFLGPGGIASLGDPGVFFNVPVTILSQTLVPIPEPSVAPLVLTGFVLLAPPPLIGQRVGHARRLGDHAGSSGA